MRPEDVLKVLEEAGAIRHGHFELSSGLHSPTYVQCALVLQHPAQAEQLGRALAAEFHDQSIECVVSPALGGVVIGHEVARAIGVRAMFTERDASGQLTLRRGFDLRAGERVLVVEDVWTTGGSTSATMHAVEEAGGRVVAVGALIDRSGGRLEFPVRAEALLEMKIPTYDADECPLCQSGSSAVKPGSRFERMAASPGE
jgi:orotate phosphoribosyltransferase